MTKLTNWLTTSNRLQHLWRGAVIGLFFTNVFDAVYGVGAVGGALEFKDEAYGGKFDFLDIAATVLGGIIGQVIRQTFTYFVFGHWDWV